MVNYKKVLIILIKIMSNFYQNKWEIVEEIL